MSSGVGGPCLQGEKQEMACLSHCTIVLYSCIAHEEKSPIWESVEAGLELERAWKGLPEGTLVLRVCIPRGLDPG